MIEVKTSSGFECQVDEAITNDAEALRILTKTFSKDHLKAITANFDFAEILLGEEQLQKLNDHLRGENGRVPFDKFAKEVAEILSSLGSAGKNS